MSTQEIEIAIKIRSQAQDLHKTVSAFRELRTNIDAIRSPMVAATRTAGELEKQLAELHRNKTALHGLYESSKQASSANPAGKSAEKAFGANTPFKSSLGALTKIGETLELPALNVGLAAGKLIMDGIVTGMERNAMVDDQVAAFTPLLKSADEAKQRVSELSDFAATSRFDLPSVAQASKTLEAFGGNMLSTGDGLKLVGDTAAASGHPIQDVAQHMGALYSGLKNGTPVEETTRRMMEMNLISAEQATRLNSLAETGAATGRAYEVLGQTFGRFDGTMQAQGDTLEGVIHTLKEAWLDDLGEMTAGLSNFVKDTAKSALELQGLVKTPEMQRTDAAQKALQRSLTPSSYKDVADQKAGIATILESMQPRLEALKKREEEAARMTVRPGKRADYYAYNMKALSGQENEEKDELTRLVAAYRAALKNLDGKGLENLKNREAEEAEATENARYKHTEEKSEKWLGENEASVRDKIESIEASRMTLRAQADREGDRITALMAQLSPLEESEDHSKESQQKILELSEKIGESRLRLIQLGQQINEEERAAAEKRKKEAEAEKAKLDAEEKTRRQKRLEDLKTGFEADSTTLAENKRALGQRFDLTEIEKRKQRISLLQQEILLTQTHIQELEKEKQSAPASEKAAYDTLIGGKKTQVQKLETDAKNPGADPESFSQQWQSTITALQDQWGSFAKQTASAFQSAFNSAISSISSGISGVITGTQSWGKALSNIGTSILTTVVNAIVQMGIRWIATQILMATVGKAIAAASTAATAPIAAAQTAVWATPATLATIASYGGAAAAAPGLIAGAQGITLGQSMARFAEGGLTPGTRTLAWVGERGPELVLPADVTSRLSPQQQAMLLDGRLPAVAVAGDASGATDSARSPRSVRQNHYHYWDRAQMIADSRDDISAIVHDVLRSRV